MPPELNQNKHTHEIQENHSSRIYIKFQIVKTMRVRFKIEINSFCKWA